MTNFRLFLRLTGLFALAVAASLTVWSQTVPRRVTQSIDETQFVTLKGHVRPFLALRWIAARWTPQSAPA